MAAARSTPAARRRQRLTLAQLAAYDDMLTDALIDRVFYWTTVPKNRSSYHASRGVQESAMASIIQEELVVNRDLDAGEQRLLATDGLRRFLDSLKTDKERDDFRRHLRRYLCIYLPDCPWEVGSTNRYTIVTHEACVTARRHIRRNEAIKYLSGIQVTMTPDEEKEIAVRKKDFSIVVSSRNKCTSLFMGPARFANHDCGANAKLITTGQAGIEIIATRPIDVGDEITVSYGENYFGDDNCECLCQTCEKKRCNGWAPADGAPPLVKVEASVEHDEDEDGEGYEPERPESYSLRRRRRRDDSIGGASSRTPSVTPVMRPRVYKTSRAKGSRLGNGREASSAAASPAPDAGTPRGQKRPVSAMATPPITPAKKIKYLAEGLGLGAAAASRGSSVSGSAPSSSGGSGDGAHETDITSPDKESPEPSAQTPLKSEDDGTDGLDGVAAVSPQSVGGLQSPQPSQHGADRVSPEAAVALAVELAAESSTATLVAASVESVDASQQAVAGAAAGAAPGDEEEAPAARRRRCQRRVFIKQTTPPARVRTPGDYVLTPLLLSEPEMAWIQCSICSGYFVQQNAYFTRCSCPRCERHSKLYGYVWPKTDRAGPGDREERVLDHRTVHRFLDPYDEGRARGRKGFARDDDDTDDEAEAEPPRPRGRRRARGGGAATSPAGETGDAGEVRRSGRRRRASCKLSG